MYTTFSASVPESQAGVRKLRDKYSRLICVSCSKRRIRCELPDDVEIPGIGELREVQTPCYRCRRLGMSCVVRQTILGRPNASGSSAGPGSRSRRGTTKEGETTPDQIATLPPAHPADVQHVDLVNRSLASYSQAKSKNSGQYLALNEYIKYWKGPSLLLHKPQSAETLVIINAIDTLRREKVEAEWFRHLPARYGHSKVLDLAVQAIVQVSGFARGVAGITSRDCQQAFSLVLGAVKSAIADPNTQINDHVLAAVALLAPFEGTMRKTGIPSRLHVEGMAATILGRPESHTVTQVARDILDWYAAETSIMATVQGKLSPFENIPRSYYSVGCQGGGNRSDQAQLKALANELFIRTPRLLMLVRQLQLDTASQEALLWHVHEVLQSLLSLQNPTAESRLMQHAMIRGPKKSSAVGGQLLQHGMIRWPKDYTIGDSVRFASVKDYEALTFYWQSRLSILRIESHMHRLLASRRPSNGSVPLPSFSLQAEQICALATNLIASSDYAPELTLFRHKHLLAHAMITVWGAKKDDLIVSTEAGGLRDFDLLLQRFNYAMGIEPEFLAEDMDEAAEIFMGGERSGRYARLYS